MIKKCSKCGLKKELNAKNFHKNTASKDGFSSNCKVCKKARDQQRYEKNRKKISIQKAEYYQKNKDLIKEARRKHYNANLHKLELK